MEYVRLGTTGLKVSRLCLGTMTYGSTAWRAWALDEARARPFFERAIEAGINFFDTADAYSAGESERILGRALRDLVPDREDAVIATKCFMGTHGFIPNRWGLSRKHILASCDASLRRLGVDYIDLYQIHRFDTETPAEEIMAALDSLVSCGKVRYLGASSMYAWEFQRCQHIAERNGWARFVSMQNYYNLLYREEEREMIPLCAAEGVGLIPWSPLARGYLARRSFDDRSTARSVSDEFADRLYDPSIDEPVVRRNAEVADRLGVPPAQVALAWLLSKPGVCAPIIGASKPGHLDDALAALTLRLPAEDIAALEEPYRAHPVLGMR